MAFDEKQKAVRSTFFLCSGAINLFQTLSPLQNEAHESQGGHSKGAGLPPQVHRRLPTPRYPFSSYCRLCVSPVGGPRGAWHALPALELSGLPWVAGAQRRPPVGRRPAAPRNARRVPCGWRSRGARAAWR